MGVWKTGDLPNTSVCGPDSIPKNNLSTWKKDDVPSGKLT